MARIDKGALTRLEIMAEASRQFLEKGYSHTTIASIATALDMSKGNLTFYFATKEHLLAELVDLLCNFHWKQMEREADEGISSILAVCLELTAMAGACEDDSVIRDFFFSSYTSPMCLEVIRANDAKRAKDVFAAYRPDWTDVQFEEAELLVSGIEYGTLMTTSNTIPFETRISGAIHNILGVYGVPEDVRNSKLKKVFLMDYRNIGKKAIRDFKSYVAAANEQALQELIHIKKS